MEVLMSNLTLTESMRTTLNKLDVLNEATMSVQDKVKVMRRQYLEYQRFAPASEVKDSGSQSTFTISKPRDWPYFNFNIDTVLGNELTGDWKRQFTRDGSSELIVDKRGPDTVVVGLQATTPATQSRPSKPRTPRTQSIKLQNGTVKIGDYVGFKGEIEQIGILKKIGKDQTGRDVLVIENPEGFDGDPDETRTVQLAKDCWSEN
jgi:hypothetical protein